MNEPGCLQFLNPTGMHHNPAFTNVVVASGAVKTIYIGAVDPIDASGKIIGRGDIAAQTEQLFKNLQAALAAAGATLENVALWRIYIVQGQPVQPAFEAFQRVWGKRPNPPANTIVFVSSLGNPDFLIDLEAIAVVPA